MKKFKLNLMTSKNKLLSIGKLSISTLLLFLTSINVAKAAVDPAAPSDTFVVYPPPDGGNYVQFNWIDNSPNELGFKVTVTKLNVGTETHNVIPNPGRGQRVGFNLQGISSGSYKYSVCAQLPLRSGCSLEKTFQIAQAPGNNNPNPPANFPPPTNVRATRVGASTERIFWNHPGVAQSFRVDIRRPGNNNFTQAAVVSGNQRQADIGSLLINTNYPVRVCGRSGIAPQEVCSPTINVVLPQGF
jgi:Fibronectin type III domain